MAVITAVTLYTLDARSRSKASAMTMAVMASTIGTARGSTHGSCLPFPLATASCPAVSTVLWSCMMVATGLKAMEREISSPFEIPPWIPPLLLLVVFISPSAEVNESFC